MNPAAVLAGVELGLMLLLPLVLGAALLRALGIAPRTDPVGFAGWSWMVGSFALGALELVRLVTGLGSPGPVAASALVLAGAALYSGRKRPALAPVRDEAREGWLGRAFFGCVLALVVAVWLQRVTLASWDAIVREDEALFWSKRAKLWFEAGGMGGVYAKWLAAGELPNADYPVLNPLLQLWAYDVAGRVTHVVNRVPIQLCSLALFLCTASALRRAAGPTLAGALLLALSGSPAIAYAARHASSDALSAMGAVVAVDAFLRWSAERERAWIRLAGLALGYALFSKNEGMLFLAAFVAAFAFEHRRRARDLLRVGTWLQPWWLPAVAVVAVTMVHNRWFRTVTYHSPLFGSSAGIAENLGRDLADTLTAFGRAFAGPALGYVYPAFLALAVLAPAARRGALGVVSRAVLLVLAGFVFVYVAKPMDPSRVLRNSLDRVLFQLVPVLLVWIAWVADGLRAELRAQASASPPPA